MVQAPGAQLVLEFIWTSYKGGEMGLGYLVPVKGNLNAAAYKDILCVNL